MNYQKFWIDALHSNEIENFNNEVIAELILLEQEKAMNTCISPMLQYYRRYFCKQPTSSDQVKG